MGARVRTEPPQMCAHVAAHADMEITLAVERAGGEGASIHFGCDGPELSIDFADADSLERLSAVAADGARQVRDQTAGNTRAAAADDAHRLVGAGAAR